MLNNAIVIGYNSKITFRLLNANNYNPLTTALHHNRIQTLALMHSSGQIFKSVKTSSKILKYLNHKCFGQSKLLYDQILILRPKEKFLHILRFCEGTCIKLFLRSTVLGSPYSPPLPSFMPQIDMIRTVPTTARPPIVMKIQPQPPNLSARKPKPTPVTIVLR